MAEYEYVVVGAGSSGCVLANRLSAGGKRVLLLEAGPADRRRSIRVPAALTTLQHTELDWSYVTEPQPHLEGRCIKVPRGHVLGGSSSINAQVYLRGHRADFDRWVRLGLAVKRLPPSVIESAASSLRYAVTRRGRLASNQAEAAAFVKTEPELDAPDLELLIGTPELRPLYLTPRWAAARLRDLALVFMGRRRRRAPRMLVISPVVIQPRSSGSLELRSADPLDSVRIDPNYLSDARDADLLVSGFRLARRIAATAPLSDHVDFEFIPGHDVQTGDDIKAFVRAHTRSLQHLAGTCRMGTDGLAVVDSALRVRGVDGLRVVDASVLPYITRGHLNAPAVMIAERAADLIISAKSTGTAVTRSH
jgi:choline dehydrogenase-like flavoprotein